MGKLEELTFAGTNAICGVIFDLDGVLTNTIELHYLAWQKFADEENLPFNRQMSDSIRGLGRRESLLYILGDRTATEAEIQEMMERKNRYYLELMQKITTADLLPGVKDLLQDIKGAGVKVGLGSSSKNARTVIEKLGIVDQLDAVADGYSVVRLKPAPDIFLFTAQKLGVAPAQCMVVEDATAGIEAAHAAGMRSVGLGPVERVGKAHLVLPNLENLRWADLHQQVVST